MSTVNVVEEPKKPKKTLTAEHSKFKATADKSVQKSGTPPVAEATKTGKKKKKAKTEATKQNIANAGKNAAKSTVERESKYSYSDDCKTAKDKKEFRRKARAAAAAFDKELKTLKKKTDAAGVKEYQKAKKEFSTWKKATYTNVPDAEEKEVKAK